MPGVTPRDADSDGGLVTSSAWFEPGSAAAAGVPARPDLVVFGGGYTLYALGRRFSDWIEQPLSIARYEIRGPNRLVSDRPTILEMLAFRRAATRVVELTDMLLLSLIAVTAGRSGPLRFAVTMMGPGPQEARNLVEQVVGQVQGMLPEGLDLVASIARYEPGVSVRSLVDPA